MAINEKLKYYRAKNNFTQTQVSAALGIDRSTYSYYELGKTIPSINMLSNIAKLFYVAIFDLLDTEKGSDHLSSTTYNPGYYSGERPLSSATLDREEKDLLLLFRQLDDGNKIELIKKAEALKERQYSNIE